MIRKPKARRGTSNSNKRGSSYDRRARRAKLAKEHDARFGRVYCHWCGKAVREWEVDRWPLCGHAGGRYVEGNVVPACRPCNEARGRICQTGGCPNA